MSSKDKKEKAEEMKETESAWKENIKENGFSAGFAAGVLVLVGIVILWSWIGIEIQNYKV